MIGENVFKKIVLQILIVQLCFIPVVVNAQSLWRVSSPSTYMFLGGSIHRVKNGDMGDLSHYKKALDSVDILITETGMNFNALNKIPEECEFPPVSPLKERIGEQLYQKLQVFSEQILTPEIHAEFSKNMDAMTTRHLLSALNEAIDYSRGIKYDYGVEAIMLTHAINTEKFRRIVALDNKREGCKIIRALSKEETKESQIRMLDKFITETHKINIDEYEKVLNNWKNKNNEYVNTLIEMNKKKFPLMIKYIINMRNKHWLKDLDMYLSGNVSSFTLVGDMHLYGDEGLLTLLRKRGYNVEEIK